MKLSLSSKMADSAAGRKMLDRCAVQKLTGRHSTEEGKSQSFAYFDGKSLLMYYYHLSLQENYAAKHHTVQLL